MMAQKLVAVRAHEIVGVDAANQCVVDHAVEAVVADGDVADLADKNSFTALLHFSFSRIEFALVYLVNLRPRDAELIKTTYK